MRWSPRVHLLSGSPLVCFPLTFRPGLGSGAGQGGRLTSRPSSLSVGPCAEPARTAAPVRMRWVLTHTLRPVETQSCDFRKGDSGLAQGGIWGIRNPGQKFLFKITSFATNFPGEQRGSVFSRMGSIPLRAHELTEERSQRPRRRVTEGGTAVTEE